MQSRSLCQRKKICYLTGIKKKLLVALWWVWLKIAVPASGADPYELLYGYGIRIHADPDQDPRKIIKNVLPKIQFLIINIIHKLI